jgi:hypothetical protein
LQHWSFVVQACPAPVQLLVWQVPVVEPAGIAHWNPVQQSAVLVQADPCGWQMTGGAQVRFPGSPMHRSEQQSVFTVQVDPLALQTPASGVPASGVPASPESGMDVWHT